MKRFELFYTGLASTPNSVLIKDTVTGERVKEITFDCARGKQTRREAQAASLKLNAEMAKMNIAEYEQSDIWIEQVDAAYKAFHERTENGLLAIEYLIHDLERIKAGEEVFTNQTI